MSEKLTHFLELAKELKAVLAGLIGVIVIAMAIGAALMEWRISVNVAEALSAQDLGTDAKIVSMDTNIADNKRTGEENAEDIEQNRRNVEAAFRRLMGLPQDDPSE
jgi:predicted transcriptional regulator